MERKNGRRDKKKRNKRKDGIWRRREEKEKGERKRKVVERERKIKKRGENGGKGDEGRERGGAGDRDRQRGKPEVGGGAGVCGRAHMSSLVHPPLHLSPVMWGGFISPGAAGSVTDLIKLFSIKKLPRHSSTSASRDPAGIKC